MGIGYERAGLTGRKLSRRLRELPDPMAGYREFIQEDEAGGCESTAGHPPSKYEEYE